VPMRPIKKQRKKPYHGKLAIHPDCPCGPIEIPFGVVGGLLAELQVSSFINISGAVTEL